MDLEDQKPRKNGKRKKAGKRKRNAKGSGPSCSCIYGIVVTAILLLVGCYGGYCWYKYSKFKSERGAFLKEINDARADLKAYATKLKIEYKEDSKKGYKLDKTKPEIVISKVDHTHQPSEFWAMQVGLESASIDGKLDQLIAITGNAGGLAALRNVVGDSKLKLAEANNLKANVRYDITVWDCSSGKEAAAALMLATKDMGAGEPFDFPFADGAGTHCFSFHTALHKDVKFLESFACDTVKVDDKTTKRWRITLTS